MSYKLSSSSLSLMKECPRCFWLTQHKVWSRPVGIFPSLPSGMDSILKKHFDRFMEKGELPPELHKSECKTDCRLFDDRDLMKIWRSNLKGISFADEDGNVLHGAVDNIMIKGKKLIVLDYKTRGFPLKEDTHEHYQDQLDIYNYLLRENGYETEDYGFLLFYHPTEVLESGEVIFETNLVKMKIDVGNAKKIFIKAIGLLKGECPSKSCEWCKGR